MFMSSAQGMNVCLYHHDKDPYISHIDRQLSPVISHVLYKYIS